MNATTAAVPRLEVWGVPADWWTKDHGDQPKVLIEHERIAGGEDPWELARYLSSGNDAGAPLYSPDTGGHTEVRDQFGRVHAGYLAGEVDHRHCPPGRHDFDPDGTEPGLQKIDPEGRRHCNDCAALCFYCTLDDLYHHAALEGEPPANGCFLIPEPAWPVQHVPARLPVPHDWPGNECQRDPCPESCRYHDQSVHLPGRF